MESIQVRTADEVLRCATQVTRTGTDDDGQEKDPVAGPATGDRPGTIRQ
jgi:hypothetical protein